MPAAQTFTPGKYYEIKVSKPMEIAGLKVRPRDRPVFDGAVLNAVKDEIIEYKEVAYG